ncbi:hypothetical protein ATO6_11290 [Oceanicola sp. 22II-s10i]|uniref:hypothetical protein n=1 Tax=Oceanicola sp. 22II-s10i TaxID=1317116 RepID=UPI000B529167|nr:hypothetical protein [Oceanicola sp. 22II-s10i]OWU84890.1 hypothetical protein ATO6_11290 [Oceanicola sp. 22II-s10i]
MRALSGYALPLLCALPLGAAAEGARLELACSVTATCAADGTCAQADAESGATLRFVVEPEALDPQGRGDYSVWVDDGAAQAASGLSRTGPFLWSPEEGQLMTLALTGETTALLIRQTVGGTTDTDFLTCEVTF